jgi:hypothetical protein
MDDRTIETIHPPFICPVCGYDKLEENPLDDTHEICPCCSIQFGYNDAGPNGKRYYHLKLRQIWVNKYMPWWSKSRLPPDNWSPGKQLLKAYLTYKDSY